MTSVISTGLLGREDVGKGEGVILVSGVGNRSKKKVRVLGRPTSHTFVDTVEKKKKRNGKRDGGNRGLGRDTERRVLVS